MLHFIPALLLAATQPTASGGPERRTESSGGAALGWVDAGWLERALRRDPKADARALVDEFARAHPSTALPEGAAVGERAYLRVLTANLDDDREPEHLLLIGPDPANTELYVLDRRSQGWAIALEEQLLLHNEEPELHVLRDGLFYARTCRERGSGVWLFTWRFFKFVDGRVVDALEVVQESNLSLEASDLYQHATAAVRESPGGFTVDFKYGFSPSRRLLVELGRRKDFADGPDVRLISGKATVAYAWDPAHQRLVARYVGGTLDDAKVRSLAELGQEEHVAAAFRRELQELARQGNADQRAAAGYLLEKVAPAHR